VLRGGAESALDAGAVDIGGGSGPGRALGVVGVVCSGDKAEVEVIGGRMGATRPPCLSQLGHI